MKRLSLSLILGLLLLSPAAFAVDGVLPALTVTTTPDGGTQYSVTMQILLLMTAMSFLPAMIIMLTSFTRIIVVLSILRQAIGLQQTPSNQVLIGISMFMTFFIMAPVFDKIYDEAVKPYIAETMNIEQAFNIGKEPIKTFMLAQTRVTDLDTFIEISGYQNINSPEDVPDRKSVV